MWTRPVRSWTRISNVGRLPALLLLLVLGGCGGDRRDVEEVMRLREEALSRGDVTLYVSLLSSAYRKERPDLEQNLRGSGLVGYRSLDRRIHVKGDTAEVAGCYVLKAKVRGRVVELTGQETIVLRREKDGWKIAGGL